MVSELDDPIFRRVEPHALRADVPSEEGLAGVPADVEFLDCEDVALANVTPLLGFSRLRVLNVSSTGIASLAGLERLTALEILYADFGRFATLEPLARLGGLRALDVSCNGAERLALEPLSACTRLERLYLAHCPIASIAPIMHLPALRLLSIAGTLVPDEEIDQFRAQHPACEIWP